MNRWRKLVALMMLLGLVAAACSDDDDGVVTPSDDVTDEVSDDEAAGDAATVAFGALDSPVAQRFDVSFEATGIEIEPAGEVVEGAGHFHVIIDAGCVAAGETVPADAQHLHFGGGQLGTQLFLEPGDHDLCLQVADGAHTALDVTAETSVTVDGDLPFLTLTVPDGDELTSPVTVTFAANGLDVAPVADAVDGAVHLHVMVDTECVDEGETIPADDQHLHFGTGALEADLDLDAGEHTLCLQAGDNDHVATAYTHVVSVTVV